MTTATRNSPPIRHQASGNWRLGLGLSLITVGMWSTLPIGLKITLEVMDPWTLTWYRFLVAAVFTGGVLALNGRWRGFVGLPGSAWTMLVLAGVMLTANYVLFLMGLKRTTPGNTQVIIQLAPLLMAMGGLALFGERYTRRQWLGFCTLILGMGLFFSDQLRQLVGEAGRYYAGTLFIVGAAVTWAVYALAQKQLLARLSSQSVMMFIYLMATLVLLPFCDFGQVLDLDFAHWVAFVYCCLNTLGAYGAFAEAMNHWEASRVSAVLAVVPLCTLVVVEFCHALWPDLVAEENLAPLGYLGAVLVVTGSMVTSLGRRGPRVRPGTAEPCPPRPR